MDGFGRKCVEKCAPARGWFESYVILGFAENSAEDWMEVTPSASLGYSIRRRRRAGSAERVIS